MKKKSSIIISSVAAVSILASAFAFNSFAVEKPVDLSPSATSNIATLVKNTTESTPAVQTDNTTTANTLKATPVNTTSVNKQSTANCPKTQKTTNNNTQNNIKSADITKTLQTITDKTNCSKTNAKKIDYSTIKAKLEALLKAQGITSTAKTTTSTPTTSKPATSTPSTSKPAASTPSTTTNGDYSAFQKKVVELVNAERAKNGLKPLTMNAELSKVATLKSQDMAKLNYFDHNSPTYGSPFEMMKKYGISYRTAGENIAMGQTSPEQVMQGWMNSPGHRKNILNSSFTQIGVGIAKNSSGRLYWTQQFIG